MGATPGCADEHTPRTGLARLALQVNPLAPPTFSLLEPKLSAFPLVLGHRAHWPAFAVNTGSPLWTIRSSGSVAAISASDATQANTVLAIKPILAGRAVFAGWTGLTGKIADLSAQVSQSFGEQCEDAAIIAVHLRPPRRAGPRCGSVAPGSARPSGLLEAAQVRALGLSRQPRVRAEHPSRPRCA